MTTCKALDIYDTYMRFASGKKVREDSWDYVVVPNNAMMMKDKYGISFGKNIRPEDQDLSDRLFQAGLDMLVTTGFYNTNLGRVMYPTKEEVLEGIRKAPKKLRIGEGKDMVECMSRHGNARKTPVIEAGPTGAPVSEEIFSAMMQSYVQEPVVDALVSGVLNTVRGESASTNTPWEIRATLAEIRHVREACAMCGRPGMGI